MLAEDASLMGTTLVLTDKTDIERIRHEQKLHQEISSELALGLRDSLTTIAGCAQQLARSRDPNWRASWRKGIAHEAAQLDRTIGSFLGGAPGRNHTALDISDCRPRSESRACRKDDHMKKTKFMAIGTLLLLGGSGAAAQSLGDYARAVRKKKAEPTHGQPPLR